MEKENGKVVKWLRQCWWMVLLAGVLIGLDQLTKYLAAQYLKPAHTMPFIPGLVQLRYVENRGAAFSFFNGKQVFLIIVTSIALLGVAYILFVRRPKDKLERAAFLLILAGGVGNLIDRVANGFVVDFFDLLFMNFAVFNVADCFVCVGFGLLVIAVVRQELTARKSERDRPETDAGKQVDDG